jgi:hypothetical protein
MTEVGALGLCYKQFSVVAYSLGKIGAVVSACMHVCMQPVACTTDIGMIVKICCKLKHTFMNVNHIYRIVIYDANKLRLRQ